VADAALFDTWLQKADEDFLAPRWFTYGAATARRETHALIAVDTSSPVAVVLFDYYTASEAQVFMLVAPTARRRGIGTALLIAGLARTGAALVKADVKRGNEGSVRAVLAAGFTELIPPDVRDSRFVVWTRSGIPYAPCWG
jgi:GNAT superfamily N-acetyltransferase